MYSRDEQGQMKPKYRTKWPKKNAQTDREASPTLPRGHGPLYASASFNPSSRRATLCSNTEMFVTLNFHIGIFDETNMESMLRYLL